MMSYSTAWWVIAAAAGVGIGCLYVLIRAIPSAFLRTLGCAVVLAFFLTPAPVPGYPSSYAPAFIVAAFEGLLKSDGSPGVALRLLALGFALVIALVTLTTLAWRRWKPGVQAPE